jgi:hypothetical protein
MVTAWCLATEGQEKGDVFANDSIGGGETPE